MESRFSFSPPLGEADILWVSLFLSPLSIVGVEKVSYRHIHEAHDQAAFWFKGLHTASMKVLDWPA